MYKPTTIPTSQMITIFFTIELSPPLTKPSSVEARTAEPCSKSAGGRGNARFSGISLFAQTISYSVNMQSGLYTSFVWPFLWPLFVTNER